MGFFAFKFIVILFERFVWFNAIKETSESFDDYPIAFWLRNENSSQLEEIRAPQLKSRKIFHGRPAP